jgi:alkyldihydroxyacetonephosphate synthase
MRRWNGWGDDTVHVALPSAALSYLRERLGPGVVTPDAPLERVVARVPPARLPSDPRIDTNAETRARHARGQSFPDWLALRFGRVDAFPDGVVFPQSSQEVRELLTLAADCGARVIPYGGGTSVVGGVNAMPGDAPVLTISLARMRNLLALDETSRLARFEAGTTGADLETQLRARGYTLGHFPQSFDYSTLGGWIATRSAGQQSLMYGRIDALFAGARIETPCGTLRIPALPSSAAALDVRNMILGSEGRIGIITEATVRVQPIAEREAFHAWFFRDWKSAQHAVRTLAQSGAGLSMLRLAGEIETFTTLRMAGKPALIGLVERALRMRGIGDGKCLLIAGVTESEERGDGAFAAVRRACKAHAAFYAGKRIGNAWAHQRFRGAYLRNTLWDAGYGVDTVETAVDWEHLEPAMRAMERAGTDALQGNVHAYSHLSHVYPQGSSVYSTFVFPLRADYDENLTRWRALKAAVSEAILKNGGTITHQHGVGTDHAPYLHAEKGALGVEAMRALFARFDPHGMMNPGKVC